MELADVVRPLVHVVVVKLFGACGAAKAKRSTKEKKINILYLFYFSVLLTQVKISILEFESRSHFKNRI